MGKNAEPNLQEIRCEDLELIILAQNTCAPVVQRMTCAIGIVASMVANKREN